MSWRVKLAKSLISTAMRLAGSRKLAARFQTQEVNGYTEDGIPWESWSQLYVNAYVLNPWMRSCMMARMDATASAPLVFGRERKVENQATGATEMIVDPVPVRKGSIAAAFKKPNSYLSEFDLWELVTAWLLLGGNAFLFRDRKVNELWPLIPERIKIVPHRTKFISHYIYTVNGQPFDLAPEDVLHFKYFSPVSSWYGLGPIQALYQALLLDKEMAKYLNRFFKKGGRLAGVISNTEDADPDIIARQQMQFNQDHAGVDNMHKVVFLSEGQKWQSIGQSNKDLELGSLQMIPRDIVQAILRTPPAVAGRWDQARFSNAREQVRLFFEAVQFPFWGKLSSTLNNHPMVEESGLISAFDSTQIPSLRESDDAKAERGRLLIQSGQWTPDEVRRDFWKKPPYANGEGSKPIFPKTGRNEDMGKNDPKADGDKNPVDRPGAGKAEEEKKKGKQQDPEQAALQEWFDEETISLAERLTAQGGMR